MEKKAIGKVGSERVLTHFVLAGRNHEISAHIQLSARGKSSQMLLVIVVSSSLCVSFEYWPAAQNAESL